MSGRRIAYIAVIVALALTAGLFISNQDTQATSFRPVGAGVWLSDYDLGANADIHIPFSIPAPDAQFGTYVTALSSPEFSHVPVTKGKTVGYLMANATLGLLNQGCLTPVTVNFRLVEASTDNSTGNECWPSPLDSPSSPYFAYTQDDGDIDQDGTIDNFAYAGNGVPDGADWYPGFLNLLFGDQVPSHRYFGWQRVTGGEPARVIMQLVFFDAGALYNLPSIPSSDLLTAGAGLPTFVILNDPTGVVPQTIEDFCTPLETTTTLCGMTDDDPDDPLTEVPDCDVGASSEVRGINPTDSGTYFLRLATMSMRDADDDDIESFLDTCPLDGNPDGWDPRATLAVNHSNGSDEDEDSLPKVCDPDDDDIHLYDADEDGWTNRIDNCPLVPNVADDMTIPNKNQLDLDIPLGMAVPDGGPPMDFIGPECDPHPNSPDGLYHLAVTIDHMCLGETDNDNDDVCSTYPGENDGSTDTDGDGVPDDNDNCIGRYNPHPTSPDNLTQMSPDILSDGIVLVDDVGYVAAKFGKGIGQSGYRAAAELATQDGSIQIDDVAAAAAAFGKKC